MIHDAKRAGRINHEVLIAAKAVLVCVALSRFLTDRIATAIGSAMKCPSRYLKIWTDKFELVDRAEPASLPPSNLPQPRPEIEVTLISFVFEQEFSVFKTNAPAPEGNTFAVVNSLNAYQTNRDGVGALLDLLVGFSPGLSEELQNAVDQIFGLGIADAAVAISVRPKLRYSLQIEGDQREWTDSVSDVTKSLNNLHELNNAR